MLLIETGFYALCPNGNQTLGCQPTSETQAIPEKMKKIIFHCGSAKTGSTSIQARLMASPAVLAENGAFYCPRMVRSGDVDPLNTAIRDVRSARLRETAIIAGRARLDVLFHEHGFDTVIVSNESALGDPFNDRMDGFFPLLHAALDGLKDMFAGYQVIPIFFIRDQASLLPSFYGQRVRQGASYSFSEFLSRVTAFDLSWQPVVAAISEAFPAPELGVHQFESFAAAPGPYTEALFAPLVGMGRLPKAPPIMKNRGAKTHALALMRGFNSAVDSFWFLNDSKRLKFKKRIRRTVFPILERLKTGRKLLHAQDPQIVAAHALYEQDLVALGIKKGAGSEEPALKRA